MTRSQRSQVIPGDQRKSLLYWFFTERHDPFRWEKLLAENLGIDEMSSSTQTREYLIKIYPFSSQNWYIPVDYVFAKYNSPSFCIRLMLCVCNHKSTEKIPTRIKHRNCLQMHSSIRAMGRRIYYDPRDSLQIKIFHSFSPHKLTVMGSCHIIELIGYVLW